MMYQHDMLHCAQHKCKKKDQCYRYWLGKEIKYSGFQYASYFHPEEPVTDGCEYFLNIKNYQIQGQGTTSRTPKMRLDYFAREHLSDKLAEMGVAGIYEDTMRLIEEKKMGRHPKNFLYPIPKGEEFERMRAELAQSLGIKTEDLGIVIINESGELERARDFAKRRPDLVDDDFIKKAKLI